MEQGNETIIREGQGDYPTSVCSTNRLSEVTNRVLQLTILPNVDPIIQVSFTMVALQVVHHLSRRGCHFLLSMLRYIIQLSLMHNRRIPYTKPFTQSAQMPVATRLIPSTRVWTLTRLPCILPIRLPGDSLNALSRTARRPFLVAETFDCLLFHFLSR